MAIFDGNNVTEARRKQIHDKLLDNDIHVTSHCTHMYYQCIYTTFNSHCSWSLSATSLISFSLISEVSKFRHQM